MEVTDATGGGLSTGSLLWDGNNDYWKAGVKGSETQVPTLDASGSLVLEGSDIEGVLKVINTSNGRDTFRSMNAAGVRTANLGNDGSGHGLVIVRNSSGVIKNYIAGDGDSYFTGGNVGIGTSSPDQLLHLQSTSPFLSISHTDDNSTSGILFRRTDNNQNRGTRIYDIANDAMTFRVSTDGTGEDMRIDSSGNVGIGTDSPGAKLDVSGDIRATGDVVAFASSDERLKDNVELISNPIEKVKELRGVTWEWNEEASEAAKQTPNVGVIAQEVEKVLPELVHDRENGYKGVDYSKLTGLLIEVVKTQQEKIESLESRLDKLEN